MVKYKCSKCNKIFTHKSKYIRHLNRKYSCDANVILTEKDIVKKKKKKKYVEITVPEKNFTVPCDDFTVPCDDFTVPCDDFTVPDEGNLDNFNEFTVPEEENFLKKNENIISNDNFKVTKNKTKKNFSCEYCNKIFKQKRYLVEHLKKYCKMNVNLDSIYTFNKSTFGKIKYGTKAGDIYIVQTKNDFNNDIFTVGKTTNLYNKLIHFRSNNLVESRLYFYYPFKNIKKAESNIKILLKQFILKNNIYKCKLDIIRKTILKYQYSSDNCKIENEPLIKQTELTKCTACNKIFYKKNEMFEHLNNCSIYRNKFLKKEKSKSELEQEIEDLKEQVDKLKMSQHITNNIVIAYNKQPDLSHLTDKDYLRIMNKGFKSVPKLIEEIHFNPNKPENKNIYIPSIKNKYAMGWNGNKWDVMNRNEVIDDMYDDKSNILMEKLEELESSNIDSNKLRKFKRFISKQNDDEIKNKIKEEIKLLLYNNKNNINK